MFPTLENIFDIPFYLVKNGAGRDKTQNHCHYQPRAPATILLSKCAAGGSSCHPFPTLGSGTATSGKTSIFDFDLPPNSVDAVPRPKLYMVYVIGAPLSICILNALIQLPYLWWLRGIPAHPVLKNGYGKIFVSC